MAAPVYNNVTTSTNYEPKYAIETLFPAYALTRLDGSTIVRRDYLAKIARIIKRITKYTPYQYEGYESLTTISYNFYKTTTLVHVILIFNSISHRLEIIPGSIINIPDISTIVQYYASTSKQNGVSNIGKTVLLA